MTTHYQAARAWIKGDRSAETRQVFLGSGKSAEIILIERIETLEADASTLREALVGMLKNTGACAGDPPEAHGCPKIRAALEALSRVTL